MSREKKMRSALRKDVACRDMMLALAGAVDGTNRLNRSQRYHAGHCLRCQAQLAQHRKLARALRGLRAEVLAPSPTYVNDVLAALEVEPELESVAARSWLSGRQLVYAASGLAAATAAGAVSAVVLTARSRRTRLAS